MYIRKSMISKLIQKEKMKVRTSCEKESLQQVNKVKITLVEEYKTAIKELKQGHILELKRKDRDIKKLNLEIQRNRNLYIKVRQRELALDELSVDIEYVVNSMVIKVQESLQPFYRTRAKIEATKHISDKKHKKIGNILRAVK